jgi:hypothetical protein
VAAASVFITAAGLGSSSGSKKEQQYFMEATAAATVATEHMTCVA